MSHYNYESLRRKLNDTWAATVVETSDKDYENTNFVGDYLFPRMGWDKDYVERGSVNEYVTPMGYINLTESTPMRNNHDTMVRESLTLAMKAEKDQLSIEKLRWVMMAETISATQWAELKVDGAKVLSKLNRALLLRNEIEVWNYLTYGRMWTMDGVAYDNLKPYGLDQTDIATNICFHTRENWISSGGAINATATITTDILSAITAMASGGFDMPTTMWMNSVTYNLIYGNTALNTQTLNLYNPIALKGFLGQDINWKSKGIKVSSLRPHGLDLVVFDSSYRAGSNSAVQVKFLPDYYVVLTGEKVGNRYVAPNRFNGAKDKWARTYASPNEVPGLFFEVGEYSLPFASNLDWKSHYVLYVKHTA